MSKIKTITKEQFRTMTMPTGEGKNVQEPKMIIHPTNTGEINGNTYKIKVVGDMVELELIDG